MPSRITETACSKQPKFLNTGKALPVLQIRSYLSEDLCSLCLKRFRGMRPCAPAAMVSQTIPSHSALALLQTVGSTQHKSMFGDLVLKQPRFPTQGGPCQTTRKFMPSRDSETSCSSSPGFPAQGKRCPPSNT